MLNINQRLDFDSKAPLTSEDHYYLKGWTPTEFDGLMANVGEIETSKSGSNHTCFSNVLIKLRCDRKQYASYPFQYEKMVGALFNTSGVFIDDQWIRGWGGSILRLIICSRIIFFYIHCLSL